MPLVPFILGVAAALGLRYKRKRLEIEKRENEVDETIEDSFPASDAPGYTLGRD